MAQGIVNDKYGIVVTLRMSKKRLKMLEQRFEAWKYIVGQGVVKHDKETNRVFPASRKAWDDITSVGGSICISFLLFFTCHVFSQTLHWVETHHRIRVPLRGRARMGESQSDFRRGPSLWRRYAVRGRAC